MYYNNLLCLDIENSIAFEHINRTSHGCDVKVNDEITISVTDGNFAGINENLLIREIINWSDGTFRVFNYSANTDDECIDIVNALYRENLGFPYDEEAIDWLRANAKAPTYL